MDNEHFAREGGGAGDEIGLLAAAADTAAAAPAPAAAAYGRAVAVK